MVSVWKKWKTEPSVGECYTQGCGQCVSVKVGCSSSLGTHHLMTTSSQDSQGSTCYIHTSWRQIYPRITLACLMCIRGIINLIKGELHSHVIFYSPWELLCISLFNYIASLIPEMNNLPAQHKRFLLGTEHQELIKWRQSLSSKCQCLLALTNYPNTFFRMDNELQEDEEARSNQKTEKQRKLNKEERGNERLGGLTVTAIQPLTSLMLPHRDFDKSKTVFICVFACAHWHCSLSVLYWQEDPVCA